MTELLREWSGGDPAALERLIPQVQGELRRIAAGYLRRERIGHTLQPTALVNEAYLRLVDQDRVQWQDRSHFFAIAAKIMRRILVDHARKRQADKRGGDLTRVTFDEQRDSPEDRSIEVLALDEALDKLAALDARQSRVLELRCFGGLSVEETARSLGVAPATVKRDWRTGKAWLFHELGGK